MQTLAVHIRWLREKIEEDAKKQSVNGKTVTLCQKPKSKPEDVATKCVMMITPLLDASLDPHQLIQRKKEISEKPQVSY